TVSEEAIQRARDGGGPSLIELKTVRLEGHFMGDAEQYRGQEERESLEEQDPITRYRARLLERGVATNEELTEIEERCRSEVDDAIRFARDSELPPVEEAYRCVYA
ncbi:MAG: thiamine pyrophosphate-dependent enzyme, partial [Pseudomonadota bacterium]